MTLDEFATMTRRVIANNGLDEFLPTAIYPARCHIKTLVGLPPEIEPDEPVLKWGAEDAHDGEEFLVAFKVDETHFRVIRRIGPYSEDDTYPVE